MSTVFFVLWLLGMAADGATACGLGLPTGVVMSGLREVFMRGLVNGPWYTFD